MNLYVKKVHPDAIIPGYAHPGDAGLDLYACESVSVLPGKSARIRTGISVDIPEGYVGLCWDKSGLSMNHNIKTMAGVIDSGFRGEVIVCVFNLGAKEYVFEKGHKVMQLLIQPVQHVTVIEANELSQSIRGEKGFGSSGK